MPSYNARRSRNNKLRFEICQLKFATGIFTKTSRIHFSHLARSLTGKIWNIINSSLICLQIYFKFFVILKRKPLSLKKTMIWLTFFQQRGRKILSTCTVRYCNLHIQITYGISIRPIFTLMIKRRIRCIPPP